jgi:inorganic pyrophosphatase
VCRRFFEDYKKNENKHVRVDEILGAEEAIKAVKDGLVRYTEC